MQTVTDAMVSALNGKGANQCSSCQPGCISIFDTPGMAPEQTPEYYVDVMGQIALCHFVNTTLAGNITNFCSDGPRTMSTYTYGNSCVDYTNPDCLNTPGACACDSNFLTSLTVTSFALSGTPTMTSTFSMPSAGSAFSEPIALGSTTTIVYTIS